MTVCAEPGCPELAPVGDGRCELHGRKPWAQPSKHTLSRPKNVNVIRRQVLARDRHRCQHPGCTIRASHVDHKVPVSEGGSWDLNNLQSLCTQHHAEKTLAERKAR